LRHDLVGRQIRVAFRHGYTTDHSDPFSYRGHVSTASQRDGWRIADLLRFSAIGKDAGLSATLTAFAGSGRQLGSEGFDPVVTVNESQGGRGYAYEGCASYKFVGSKLKRFDLE